MMSLSVQSNTEQLHLIHKPVYTKASDIPEFCKNIAKQLQESRENTVLILDRWEDKSICLIFNLNAVKYGGCSHPPKIIPLRDDYFPWKIHVSSNGISLLRSGDCSESLKKSYEKVLHAVQKGWYRSFFSHHPNMPFKKDPQKYMLYMKNSQIDKEVVLIRSMINRFSLSDVATCHNTWVSPQGISFSRRIYLIVEKAAVPKFEAIFGFDFQGIAKL
jgi:hypothetical protein